LLILDVDASHDPSGTVGQIDCFRKQYPDARVTV
jgi:hypothetical protein